MSILLSAKDISKRYGNKVALSDFSLTVESGDVYGILGSNGSGKTTCLHMLTGLLQRNSGEISVSGIPIDDPASRIHVGFAPDDLPMPTALTGEEFLIFYDSLRQLDNREIVRQLTRILEIDTDIKRPIEEYSHGMKRKLQLIAAISHNPDVLILDEPYRGLDSRAMAIIRKIIQSFQESGKAVIIATHDMAHAENFCNRVTILSDGRCVAAGKTDEILADNKAASLEEVFLRLTGLQEKLEEDTALVKEIIEGKNAS